MSQVRALLGEPRTAPLAQLGERDTVTVEARGSKPLRCAKNFAEIAQLVERCVEGAGVLGSTPSLGTKHRPGG